VITLILILMLGSYLGLFVVAGVKTNSWTPRIILWFVLLAPPLALTWDIPVGYYRFKQLCAAEGGMREYESNPPPAKVLRLDAEHFGESAARSLLSSYPTLDAVETRDANFSTAQPRAYARYERNPLSPVPTSGPRDAFQPVVTSLDKVEVRIGGTITLAAGPSLADYSLTKDHEDRPIRLSVTRQWLRKPGGKPVASTTSFVYAWTKPTNTLLGRTGYSYCGSNSGSEDKNEKLLLALIASTTNK
jgi:hypothetical protein